MVLVKPATVIQWHRQGFRRYWRWRSRSGRPSVDREVSELIRQMNAANPLWGAPRIHGELLKLGIEISQARVAKHIVRRRCAPSPTWRTFLRNHAEGVAAIDVFVAASASFRLLYVMIILAHDRRNILRTAVTEHPTAAWLSRQVTEAFPWDTAPRYLLRDRDGSYGSYFRNRVEAMGIGAILVERKMRAGALVIVDIRGQDAAQMDRYPIHFSAPISLANPPPAQIGVAMEFLVGTQFKWNF
jgi:hypothetical protein